METNKQTNKHIPTKMETKIYKQKTNKTISAQQSQMRVKGYKLTVEVLCAGRLLPGMEPALQSA